MKFYVKISCKRLSWSSFVICILKNISRYVNTYVKFSQVLAFGKNYFFTFCWVYLAKYISWKGLFYRFKFNLKIRAFGYLLNISIFGFSSKKNDFSAAFAVSAYLLNWFSVIKEQSSNYHSLCRYNIRFYRFSHLFNVG